MYRLILLILLLISLGCAGERRPEGFPHLVSCDIIVTQDSKPLAGASVSLFPLESGNKWSSGGTTNKNGTAVLRTHGRFDGVPFGKYKVVVQKQIMEGETGSMPMSGSPQELAEYEQRLKANPPKTYDLVDLTFTSEKTTPLEINVEKNGKNAFTLNVGEIFRQEVKILQ